MITFNDLYQMKRKAQELGWEDKYLHWHIWEPAFKRVEEEEKNDRTNISGQFTKTVQKVQMRDQILGIPATVYGVEEIGEIFNNVLVLENQKLSEGGDAFILKANGEIQLKKWWLIPEGMVG